MKEGRTPKLVRNQVQEQVLSSPVPCFKRTYLHELSGTASTNFKKNTKMTVRGTYSTMEYLLRMVGLRQHRSARTRTVVHPKQQAVWGTLCLLMRTRFYGVSSALPGLAHGTHMAYEKLGRISCIYGSALRDFTPCRDFGSPIGRIKDPS